MEIPLRCPRCRTGLVTVVMQGWRSFRCAGCDGVAITIALLRTFAPPDRIKELWRRLPEGTAGDPCPSCKRRFANVRVAIDAKSHEFDICRSCQLIWFDAKELAAFSPQRQEPPPSERRLSPRAAEAFVKAKIEGEALGERADREARAAFNVVEILSWLVP